MAGRSDPTLGTLLALADALELASIEELITPLGTTVLLRMGEGAGATLRAG